MQMEVITSTTDDSRTCIRSIGRFIFFEEDWMKQKKVITKINDMQEIKTQSEITYTVNNEINQFNT